ncbi:hypothetical protein EU524_00185 [Candidatus Thorarchaeota archaeon]|nr:MAG: hypothetical protein EU524_00185 [Candidatus Thorarchaeota archaeon]
MSTMQPSPIPHSEILVLPAIILGIMATTIVVGIMLRLWSPRLQLRGAASILYLILLGFLAFWSIGVSVSVMRLSMPLLGLFIYGILPAILVGGLILHEPSDGEEQSPEEDGVLL